VGYVKTELLDRYVDDAATQLLPPIADPTLIGFHNAIFAWGTTLDTSSGSMHWTPSRQDFRLRIEGDVLFKRGGLNLILGPTGSGKTSMLLALLGELHFIPIGPDSWYNLPLSNGIAYTAQSPWILNKTIKVCQMNVNEILERLCLSSMQENILFCEEYDERRYRGGLGHASKLNLQFIDSIAVIRQCALEPDLQLFDVSNVLPAMRFVRAGIDEGG